MSQEIERENASGGSVAELISTTPTVKQLRAACPGASDTFLLEQFELGASLEVATQAHAAVIAAENKELKEKLAASEAENAKPPAGKKKGNAALSDVAGEGATGHADAEEAYEAKINEVMKARQCSYQEAAKIVGRKHPELRAALCGVEQLS